jgi:iron(II)-dependent oxidoreductase
MEVITRNRPRLTPQQIALRKRIVGATFITCIVVAFVGGTIHVLKLGSNRIEEMRSMASYNAADETKHIRAAGEDITLHREHEQGTLYKGTYTVAEAKSLLTPAQWREVRSMVTVPAGDFIMGTSRKMANAGDTPQHHVSLPAFMIDKYPVTNAQYALFVAETHHRPPLNWNNGFFTKGKQMDPVTMISWYDANDYAKWAGKRLPTEAEWEKAARGTDGRRWPWGNQMDPSRLNTYYSVGDTTPVDRYKNGTSPYGAMDMAGDVNEWTADDFEPYPGTDAPDKLFAVKIPEVTSAADRSMKVVDLVTTDDKSHYKVLRGGSWKSDPFSTETYHRNYSLPNMTSDFFGFRTARDMRDQPENKGHDQKTAAAH